MQKCGLLASIRHILQQLYITQGWNLAPADLDVLVDQLGSQLNNTIKKLELEEKGCEELFGAEPTETTDTNGDISNNAVEIALPPGWTHSKCTAAGKTNGLPGFRSPEGQWQKGAPEGACVETTENDKAVINPVAAAEAVV
jgi:hypothetical protein